MSFRLLAFLIAVCAALPFTSGAASAQDLVYQPTNPAFGGSSFNYQWLLNSAQTQNDFDNPEERIDDPLADFQSDLQRQILRALSQEFVQERFGDLDFEAGGQFDFGDFSVTLVPGVGGLTIRIVDLLSGSESTITVPNP
jgi:curli production assembly/transport component CsgF